MTVGTELRIVKRTIVSMPLVPRSMIRDKPAGLALQMEAQRELVHVHEGPVGELAHRMLADARKEGVAQLVEAELDQPGEVIGDDQRDRRRRRSGGTESGEIHAGRSAHRSTI